MMQLSKAALFTALLALSASGALGEHCKPWTAS